MTSALSLDSLPSEILILIFDYCHAFDLIRLSEVCTRFYDIINCECLWISKGQHALVTNQCSKKFRERCNTLLSMRKKWQISHNWQDGKYKQRVVYSQKTKLMPWIHLTNNILWWSGGNQLCGFRRNKPFNSTSRIFNEENISSDICKFIVGSEHIISGHRDGSLKFWSTVGLGRNLHYTIDRAHSCDINAVDEIGEIIITGSKDNTAKLWHSPTGEPTVPSATISLRDWVWSIAANPSGQMFAVGCSGTNSEGLPLRIFDLERCTELSHLKYSHRRGAGVLDMIWDNPNTLLTCGYDTYLKKWDIRIGKCVSHWSDPTDATIYCLSSDYQYSVITGSQFNCKAVLWDQRKTNYVQLYFMHLNRISSPVYSVNFDSTYLYGATDQFLMEFDFSGNCSTAKNYRDILNYDMSRVQQNYLRTNR